MDLQNFAMYFDNELLGSLEGQALVVSWLLSCCVKGLHTEVATIHQFGTGKTKTRVFWGFFISQLQGDVMASCCYFVHIECVTYH